MLQVEIRALLCGLRRITINQEGRDISSLLDFYSSSTRHFSINLSVYLRTNLDP